jgi:acetyltransferase-like isoleucine patch superfamily enzyme
MEFEEVLNLAKGSGLYLGHRKNTSTIIERFDAPNQTTNQSLSYLATGYKHSTQPNQLKGTLILENGFGIEGFTSKLECNIIFSSNAKYLFAFIYRQFRSRFQDSLGSRILQAAGNMKISATASIAEDALIGEGVEIGEGVVIFSNVAIGNKSKIKPYTVIGGNGFGYATQMGLPPLPIPHFGGVRIGNEVEIGSHCSIDQGTFVPTIIGNHTKIDNGVHVSHNVNIGMRNIITAHVEISGSVFIGNDVWIGPNTSIRDGLAIHDGAFVGIGSVVTKDIPENALSYGNPAREHKK